MMRNRMKILMALVLVCFVASFVAGCCGGSTEPASHEPLESTPALESLHVSPEDMQIGEGKALQYSVLGKHTDGTLSDLGGSVTWSSSDGLVAEVTDDGLVTTRGYGTVEIVATLGEIVGSTTITVPSPPTVQSISLRPAISEILAGQTLQFGATATYSDGSTKDVTTKANWDTSDPLTIDIDSLGFATSQNSGTATITALLDEQSTSIDITVLDPNPTVASVLITPSVLTLIEQDSLQLKAVATYSDGGTKDITTEVLWDVSDPVIATISVLGLIEATSMGETIVTAAFEDMSASATLSVESLIDPSTLPEDDEDPMMSMVKTMIGMIFENPQGMIDMAKGMLTKETLGALLRWIAEPGVMLELLQFVKQMILSML